MLFFLNALPGPLWKGLFLCAVLLSLSSGAAPGDGACADWFSQSKACAKRHSELKNDSLQDICGAVIGKLKKDYDINELIRVSFCLQKIAPPGKASTYITTLKTRMPDDPARFIVQLKNARVQREFESALALAWLGERIYGSDPLVRQELSEIYHQNSLFLPAAKSALFGMTAGIKTPAAARFELDMLIRSAQIEIPAPSLLDTLIHTFPEHTAATLSLLEELCWIHRNYNGVFSARLRRMAQTNIPWPQQEVCLVRLIEQGCYDFAQILLEKSVWRNLTGNDLKNGRSLFLKINHQLQHWEAVLQYAQENPDWEKETWENQYYLAAAYTKLVPRDTGIIPTRRKTAAEINNSLIHHAPSPWNYRAVILQAENLIALGRLKAADSLLNEEKWNTARKETTGPLLFWSGISALSQNRFARADSMFMLASAYSDKVLTQRALFYRYWTALDTTDGNRNLFFRGLLESPLPYWEKAAALHRISTDSPLRPHAMLESAVIWWHRGKTDSAAAVLEKLQKEYPGHVLTPRARALEAFLREEKRPLLKSLAIYDEILLKYQQGVVPEFTRERVHFINSELSKRGN